MDAIGFLVSPDEDVDEPRRPTCLLPDLVAERSKLARTNIRDEFVDRRKADIECSGRTS